MLYALPQNERKSATGKRHGRISFRVGVALQTTGAIEENAVAKRIARVAEDAPASWALVLCEGRRFVAASPGRAAPEAAARPSLCTTFLV